MRSNMEKRGTVAKRRRPAPFNPRNAGAWRGDDFEDDIELVERNGNLTLVRHNDGSEQWLAPHEIQGG